MRITLRLNLSVWFLDLGMEVAEDQTLALAMSSVSIVLCVLMFNVLYTVFEVESS